MDWLIVLRLFFLWDVGVRWGPVHEQLHAARFASSRAHKHTKSSRPMRPR